MSSWLKVNTNRIILIATLLITVAIGGFYFYQQEKITDKISVEDARRVEELSKKLELSKKQEVKPPKTYEQRFDGKVFASYDGDRRLRLLAPNGKENLCRGQNFIIKWESNGLKTVSLFLKKVTDSYPPATDNPFAPRPASLGNFPASFNEHGEDNGSGEFSWRAGVLQSGPFETEVEEGTTYEILITSSDGGRLIEDTSDNVFSITYCEG